MLSSLRLSSFMLTTLVLGSGCSGLGAPWACGANAQTNMTEATTVTKPGATKGGVLCCKN